MKIRKFIAGAAVAVLAVLGTGLAAQSASAHTPEAWADCEAVHVKATNYETKPATEAQTEQRLVSEAVPYQPAVYGERPVIYPAQEYKPAVYETEYEYRHADNGNGNSNKTRWEREGWNAGNNGKGWVPTGNTRQGKLISAEVPAKEAVLGEAPLISAEVPAKDAVYETVEIAPATPADSQPNTVSVTVDGLVVLTDTFGSSFETSVALNKELGHEWSVTITAWNDPDGSKGWTKTISGTTTPCVTEVPNPDLDKVSGSIAVDCEAETVTFSATNENDFPVLFLTQFDWDGDGDIDSGDGFTVGANDSDTSVYPFSVFDESWTLTAYLTVGETVLAQSEEFAATPCEEPVLNPANPTATITAVCGAADVILTNPLIGDANQTTASFVVELDGEFYGAYAVEAGNREEIAFEFDEDSGEHVIEVFQAGTSERKSIAKGTVPSDCIVSQPEDKVVEGEWSKPVVTCDNKVGDVIEITREVTTTPYVLIEGEWVLDTENAVTVTEEDTYTVTAEDIKTLDCEVPTTPEEPEEPTTPTTPEKPVTPTTPEKAAPTQVVKASAVTPEVADVLAATGANPGVTILALTGGALMVAVGALAVVLGLRARQMGTTED